ncbi:uncharacterized protein B0J16DRAFT_402434 [Fusarium flagelliforme]|uniref:uncharacterized protein n=1 Tax=Fusarium flagelliforme TaxID=2675880 RepID=UPI001E8D4E48|nr:uncharacterized protein B0J16DRAFT_402434 [Fusarium flagelliforme]KAH7179070.1 hypothetical protein B0J16DRAFT_402434 [Fusarium flagelliforme]
MSSGDKRGPEIDSGHDSGPFKRSRAPDTPPPDHQPSLDEYTVGCVCAHDFEMAAVEGMLEKPHPQPAQQDPNDHNSYILGEVWGHNVVIACLPDGIHGTTTAATVAKDMLRTFKSIRFGLMVGVGGGIPSKDHDIRLGDIVVSRPSGTNGGVVQYDLGKALQEGKFQRTGSLNAPPQVLLAALTQLKAKHLKVESRVPEFLGGFYSKLHLKKRPAFTYPGTLNDCLFLPDYSHSDPDLACDQCDPTQTVSREGRDDTEPVIHYGTIASGNEVIKDSKKRDQIGKELGALCLEMEAAGLQDFPCIVIRGICDYADSHKNNTWQLYAAAAAAAFAKELLSVIPPSRVLQENPIPQLVSLASESLNMSKQHLDMSSRTLGEQRRTNKVLEGRAIDLYIVHEACYDSEDVGSSPRCEANTRARLQEAIREWADDEEGHPFLWLVGPAGTGKSTLIRSVADSFHQDKRLVAGYFFKRGEQGRNDTNRLFSTLAIQLAEAIPSFKDSLRASVGGTDKDSIEKKDLRFQFEKLIKKPIEGLSPSDTNELPRIIVLDALDECERPENLPRALTFISEICNKSTALELRVLLTSRPDPKIINAFEPLIQNGVTRRLQLHRVFSADTKNDIRLYLQTNFMRIKTKANIQQNPWPTVAEIDHLVELSTHPEPLFIYAATLLRFVYDEKQLQNPKNQLKIWIKQCEDNKSQLHQMYNPILEQIFALGKDTDFDQQLQFLGALVLTALPLSVTSLTSLLDLDIDDVSWWLPSLHAVINIPSDSHKPLRLHHKSFSDFLLSEENPRHDRFRLDAREIHALLADRCIGLMRRQLKRDICDLSKLDVTSQDIDKTLIGRCIPFELQYSCHYWGYHVRASGNIVFNHILAFFLEHFLHWLEVSALLNQTSVALTALEALYDVVKTSRESSSELIDFLKDATRTVSSFAAIIESAPLQTYASLLLFSPQTSKVRQRLWYQRLPPLSYIQGVKPDWDVHMQTIEVQGNVKALAFSPNDRFLASADSAVRLWNASTGTHLTSFEEPGFHPVDVIFSSSNQLLAARCSEGIVKIWDMSTWTHLQTIESSDGGSHSISIHISFDDEILISAQSCGEVRLCHTRSGQRLGTKRFGSGGTIDHLIAISPKPPLIAFCAKDCDITLLNVATSAKQKLRTGGELIESVTLSPDGKFLAGVFRKSVCLWDTATHKRDPITTVGDGSCTIAFLSNSRSLVVRSKDTTLLWNLATGSRSDLMVSNTTAIALSSDGRILATAPDEPAIKLWDLGYAKPGNGVSSFRRAARAVAFSSDGRVVVSQQDCHTISLHDATTGSHTYILDLNIHAMVLFPSHWLSETVVDPNMLEHTPRIDNITFSPDSQSLAIGMRGGTILLWHTKTRKFQHVIRVFHTLSPGKLIFSPNGEMLAAMSNTIMWWDVSTGIWRDSIHEGRNIFRASAFSPNLALLGALCANRSSMEVLTLYHIKIPKRKHTLNGHEGHGVQIIFSPNSLMVAVASDDRTVRLWHTATYIHLHTIDTCTYVPEMMRFSRDGSVIAVASADDSIRLWNITEDRLLQLIHHDGGSIRELRILANELILIVSDIASFKMLGGWESCFTLSEHSYAITYKAQLSTPERLLSEIGIDVDHCWIMKGDDKVVFIPPEYRPTRRFRTWYEHANVSITRSPLSFVAKGYLLFTLCPTGQAISFRYSQESPYYS